MSSINEIRDKSFFNETNSNYSKNINDEKNSNIKFMNVIENLHLTNLMNNNKVSNKKVSYGIDDTIYEEDYNIAISQNGRFAVIFDSANLRIKVIENTDHRPFIYNKKKIDSRNMNESNGSDKFNEVITYFKIQNDFTIDKFYHNDLMPAPFNKEVDINVGGSLRNDIEMEGKENFKNDDKFKWSYDISNMHNKNGKRYIFVAVSRIEVEKFMTGKMYGDNEYAKISKIRNGCKSTVIQIKDGNGSALSEKSISITIDMQPEKEKQKLDEIKGTCIYCIELKRQKNGGDYIFKKVTCNYYSSISGICRFIEEYNKSTGSTVKRFIILNFGGIYNFNFHNHFQFTEKFNYPKSVKRELNYWYITKSCMNRLLSCLCDKYFVVKQHKDNVELFEVFDMIDMKLTTTVRSLNDITVKENRNNIFTFSKLQFCYTQGANSIKLHYIENGLKVASKTFKEIEQIYSLEFIDSDEKLLLMGKGLEEGTKFVIWDIYNTGNVETITFSNMVKLGTRLASTSGNILQVDDEGNVRSVLKRIENKLLKQKDKEKAEKGENEVEKTMESHMERFIGTTLDGDPDKNHIIWFDKNVTPIFKPIVINKEPWVLGDYERNSYCICQNKKGSEIETLQLIVGRSTVQIWHQIQDDSKPDDDLPNKGEPFLEYIWATGIPIDQEREETRLRIEKFVHEGSNDVSNDFYLKVYWYERSLCENIEEEEKDDDEEFNMVEHNEGALVAKREKVISRKDIVDKINAIRHACKALDHLNKRKKYLLSNYSKIQKFEEIVAYIEHIVWRFIKHDPDQFKLLNVRRNVMKILILGNCSHLIKFILFGDDKELKYNEEDDKDRMIPQNDLELAIYHYKGRELKDTIIVGYLLEYYSRHATENIGWMCTVSKALPLLFKYNYDDYAKKLFRKECFADQDFFSTQDSFEIIPKKYLDRLNHDIKFRAFKPVLNLQSNKYRWYDRIFNRGNNEVSFKHKVYKFFEDFDNDLGKSPIALRVVPLPRFTVNDISKEKIDYNIFKIILNLIWFIFIPRWYKVGREDRDKLSPFSRVIRYENNDDIFDNPSTEAIIDFHWKEARNFSFLLLLRFLIFSICFVLVSWAYCAHENIIVGTHSFLAILIVIFYYLAAYLLITEFIQLYYNGPRDYFNNVFNGFDLISLIFPTVVMTLLFKEYQVSNGFESVQMTDPGLLTGISFSIFVLWIELILYLRLTSNMALYINYFLYIFKTVFPFILFMLIVIVAFAHTMFVLLRDPQDIDGIKILHNSFSGNAVDPLTNETFDVNIQSDFDPDDNPFSSFGSAIEAAYFWLSSNWVQKDQFKFWASEVVTVVASLFLVIILQNMLIAFMGGVYEKAETNGRQALLRSRARNIADYEALHHIHFWHVDPEPEYIYYIGQSKNFEEWYEMRKDDQKSIYEGFEHKSTFMRKIFKRTSYDKFSIWDYDHIKSKSMIEEIEDMRYEMNLIVEKLLSQIKQT
ncbi:hypothetical protein GLOIN_2v1769896 [Rhizophagus clarus]|uniref:Ion transport domain-containing protein n=1 Tax=Rhizophagus clarus TaxID=94130 RepID=A0A8H3LCE8_9GLOM|nr:hypothetical protein GLOIN_2v1769896 [Rhizophagus clarus]